MPSLSSVSSNSSSPVNIDGMPSPPATSNNNQDSTTPAKFNGIPVVRAVPASENRIVINNASSAPNRQTQVGTTEQQHRFDVYNTIQTTAGATSLGLGVSALKITSIAALLGAHAPIIGVGLAAFGATALFNAVTDRPFRPSNH